MNSLKFLVYASFIFLAACSTTLENPRVTLKEVRISSMDTKGAAIDVLLAVSNPNAFDLRVHGYSYEMEIAQHQFAHGNSEEPRTFPGLAESSLLIPVRISWSDVLEIAQYNPRLDNIPYQLTARLNVESPLGILAVPVVKSGTMAVPERYRPGKLLQKFGGILENMNR